MKDFTVDITKLTKPTSKESIGVPFILGTSEEQPYKEYTSLDGIATDYGEESNEYKIASRMFEQTPAPTKVAMHAIIYDAGTGTPADLVAALNELIKKNNDWYFLTCTENSDEVITALSEWIDTQMKMYFTTTQKLSLPGTLNSENTVCLYHDDVNAYIAEGLTSIAAVNEPGSITFKFKTVNGVEAANVSETEIIQLHTDNSGTYVKKLGILQTTEGKTTSGEYIDVVINAHWLQLTMEEELMYLAINNKKIPYNNVGISMLVGVASSVLQRGADQGIVLKDDDGKAIYEITVMKREEIPRNDVTNRVYDGIKWTATLEGAIHSGTLTGYLVY